MQTKNLFLALALSLAVAPASFAASDVSPTGETRDDQTQAVERATQQFYASLNALFTGDAAPMQDIWSHADDVTYMGPVGGFQVGWQQVSNRWEEQAALHLGGQIEPTEIRIVVGDALASVQCLEVGNNLDADGELERVSIRATSLFRKENGQWKMIAHHTDLLPQLEENESDEMSDILPESAADNTPNSNADNVPGATSDTTPDSASDAAADSVIKPETKSAD
ncbi:MAG TPA: nuclear transport factor 2 family protein [Pirellulales bacterium]